jgi:hypothetical protein
MAWYTIPYGWFDETDTGIAGTIVLRAPSRDAAKARAHELVMEHSRDVWGYAADWEAPERVGTSHYYSQDPASRRSVLVVTNLTDAGEARTRDEAVAAVRAARGEGHPIVSG